MTRLAVIGNSHVGAFKLGWDMLRARRPQDAVEFLAAPGLMSHALEVFDGRRFGLSPAKLEAEPRLAGLVSRINGRTDIDLAAADAVIWVGRPHALDAVVATLATFDVDDIREVGAARRLSRSAFEAICDALAVQSLPPDTWRGWRAPRLFYAPRHRPGQTVLEVRSPVTRHWRTLVERPDGAESGIAVYAAALATRLAEAEIEMVEQPPETIAANGLTAERFGKGSRRLAGALHPDDDVNHMNGEFGALALEAVFARVAALAPASAKSA